MESGSHLCPGLPDGAANGTALALAAAPWCGNSPIWHLPGRALA